VKACGNELDRTMRFALRSEGHRCAMITRLLGGWGACLMDSIGEMAAGHAVDELWPLPVVASIDLVHKHVSLVVSALHQTQDSISPGS
jgi:hypothetical protein